jgi:hypothetical protein
MTRRRLPTRPKTIQLTSVELKDRCLEFLRRKFYPTQNVQFAKDRPKLLQWVVLWPATWFTKRGVRVSEEKYLEIFEGVFMDALIHGSTKITYFPAWLRQVIQAHFSHHGETYYEEAKLLRENALLNTILSGKLQPTNPAPDPVRELASAARLLKSKKKLPKTPPTTQLPLL